MKQSKSELFILAGPNGVGKTTCAKMLLPKDVPFVNADEIAKGLKGYFRAYFEGDQEGACWR